MQQHSHNRAASGSVPSLSRNVLPPRWLKYNFYGSVKHGFHVLTNHHFQGVKLICDECFFAHDDEETGRGMAMHTSANNMVRSKIHVRHENGW